MFSLVSHRSPDRLPHWHGAMVVGGLMIAISGFLSGATLAQPVPAKPAPTATVSSNAPPAVPAEPGATTASYGDWVVRCQRLGGETGQRLCEAAQTMQVQGQVAPVAQLAVGRLPGQGGLQEGLRVAVLLPANVSFPSSVRITEAKEAGQGLELAWRRCVPGGCLADAAASDAVLNAWRGASEAGRIAFKDAAGREITVPLSFHGFGPALDALAKERP